MNDGTALFFVLGSIGFLYYGYGVYAILFKPELGAKFIEFNKTPLAPWTLKDNADILLKALTFWMFFLFFCLMVFGLYTFIS